MQPSHLASGLGFVVNEPAVTVPASTNLSIRGPSIEELDSIELPTYGLTIKAQSGTPTTAKNASTSRQALPLTDSQTTPNELEASPPVSPTFEGGNAATTIAPSFSYPAMNRWRVLSACLIIFGNGMSDAVNGALIPYMEDQYNIGYALVSLIFVANAVGFLIAAPTSSALASTLGRSKCLMLSEIAMLVGYVIIVCTPPFPAVVVAYLFLGFGVAVNLACINVFCANLANSTVVLGAAHGSYGIGGTVAPIIATALVSNGILWSRFFLITIGLRVACFFFAGWAFKDYEREGINSHTNSLANPSLRTQNDSNTSNNANTPPGKRTLLLRALSNRTTVIGALFIFSYQGGEVSESGWFITFLIDYRSGNPSRVGYVTAGFWAGITLGRFVLTHFASRIGEKRFVAGLTCGVIAFQLLAWFIPNVVGGAVAVSFLGLLLGPAYPCATTVFARLLPAELQMSALAFLSTAGSSGGAVVPFTTGILAQAYGAWVLHPVCVGFFFVMLGCWVALPKVRKRAE